MAHGEGSAHRIYQRKQPAGVRPFSAAQAMAARAETATAVASKPRRRSEVGAVLTPASAARTPDLGLITPRMPLTPCLPLAAPAPGMMPVAGRLYPLASVQPQPGVPASGPAGAGVPNNFPPAAREPCGSPQQNSSPVPTGAPGAAGRPVEVRQRTAPNQRRMAPLTPRCAPPSAPTPYPASGVNVAAAGAGIAAEMWRNARATSAEACRPPRPAATPRPQGGTATRPSSVRPPASGGVRPTPTHPRDPVHHAPGCHYIEGLMRRPASPCYDTPRGHPHPRPSTASGCPERQCSPSPVPQRPHNKQQSGATGGEQHQSGPGPAGAAQEGAATVAGPRAHRPSAAEQRRACERLSQGKPRRKEQHPQQHRLMRRLNQSASWLSDVSADEPSDVDGDGEEDHGTDPSEEKQVPVPSIDGRNLCLAKLINQSVTWIDADLSDSDREEGGSPNAQGVAAEPPWAEGHAAVVSDPSPGGCRAAVARSFSY